MLLGFAIQHLAGYMLLQVNLDMTDSMGPWKLVRHMQNLSYTYDEYLVCIELGPSISSVICKNPSYSGPSYPSSPVVLKSSCFKNMLVHSVCCLIFRIPRLKNIDRSTAEHMTVTVNNVTVIITDYKPKKERRISEDNHNNNNTSTDTSDSASNSAREMNGDVTSDDNRSWNSPMLLGNNQRELGASAQSVGGRSRWKSSSSHCVKAIVRFVKHKQGCGFIVSVAVSGSWLLFGCVFAKEGSILLVGCVCHKSSSIWLLTRVL